MLILTSFTSRQLDNMNESFVSNGGTFAQYGVRTGTANKPRQLSPEKRNFTSTTPSQMMNLNLPAPKVLGAGFRPKSDSLSPSKTRSELINEEAMKKKASQASTLRLHKSKDNLIEVDKNSLPLLSPSAKSIIAIRNQMVKEGTLPSLQPEVCLNDDEINKIGSHQESAYQVAKSHIAQKKREMMKAKASGANWDVMSSGHAIRVKSAADNKPPRMLKTDDLSSLHHMPISPYKSGDEIGKIMSSGSSFCYF